LSRNCFHSDFLPGTGAPPPTAARFAQSRSPPLREHLHHHDREGRLLADQVHEVRVVDLDQLGAVFGRNGRGLPGHVLDEGDLPEEAAGPCPAHGHARAVGAGALEFDGAGAHGVHVATGVTLPEDRVARREPADEGIGKKVLLHRALLVTAA
jgi:hypothetical protein